MIVSGLVEIGGRLLVVFDGRCGFCNRAVRWFLRRDRRDRLRFVASESAEVEGCDPPVLRERVLLVFAMNGLLI